MTKPAADAKSGVEASTCAEVDTVCAGIGDDSRLDWWQSRYSRDTVDKARLYLGGVIGRAIGLCWWKD